MLVSSASTTEKITSATHIAGLRESNRLESHECESSWTRAYNWIIAMREKVR